MSHVPSCLTRFNSTNGSDSFNYPAHPPRDGVGGLEPGHVISSTEALEACMCPGIASNYRERECKCEIEACGRGFAAGPRAQPLWSVHRAAMSYRDGIAGACMEMVPEPSASMSLKICRSRAQYMDFCCSTAWPARARQHKERAHPEAIPLWRSMQDYSQCAGRLWKIGACDTTPPQADMVEYRTPGAPRSLRIWGADAEGVADSAGRSGSAALGADDKDPMETVHKR